MIFDLSQFGLCLGRSGRDVRRQLEWKAVDVLYNLGRELIPAAWMRGLALVLLLRRLLRRLALTLGPVGLRLLLLRLLGRLSAATCAASGCLLGCLGCLPFVHLLAHFLRKL